MTTIDSERPSALAPASELRIMRQQLADLALAVDALTALVQRLAGERKATARTVAAARRAAAIRELAVASGQARRNPAARWVASVLAGREPAPADLAALVEALRADPETPRSSRRIVDLLPIDDVDAGMFQWPPAAR
jgi:outer membrane murein-binding lipoprotein Lpp